MMCPRSTTAKMMSLPQAHHSTAGTDQDSSSRPTPLEMAHACFEKIEEYPEPGRGRTAPLASGKDDAHSPHRLTSFLRLFRRARMPSPFRGENEWIETDRREQRRIVLTVLAFSAVTLAGIGILVYALTN